MTHTHRAGAKALRSSGSWPRKLGVLSFLFVGLMQASLASAAQSVAPPYASAETAAYKSDDVMRPNSSAASITAPKTGSMWTGQFTASASATSNTLLPQTVGTPAEVRAGLMYNQGGPSGAHVGVGAAWAQAWGAVFQMFPGVSAGAHTVTVQFTGVSATRTAAAVLSDCQSPGAYLEVSTAVGSVRESSSWACSVAELHLVVDYYAPPCVNTACTPSVSVRQVLALANGTSGASRTMTASIQIPAFQAGGVISVRPGPNAEVSAYGKGASGSANVSATVASITLD